MSYLIICNVKNGSPINPSVFYYDRLIEYGVPHDTLHAPTRSIGIETLSEWVAKKEKEKFVEEQDKSTMMGFAHWMQRVVSKRSKCSHSVIDDIEVSRQGRFTIARVNCSSSWGLAGMGCTMCSQKDTDRPQRGERIAIYRAVCDLYGVKP